MTEGQLMFLKIKAPCESLIFRHWDCRGPPHFKPTIGRHGLMKGWSFSNASPFKRAPVSLRAWASRRASLRGVDFPNAGRVRGLDFLREAMDEIRVRFKEQALGDSDPSQGQARHQLVEGPAKGRGLLRAGQLAQGVHASSRQGVEEVLTHPHIRSTGAESWRGVDRHCFWTPPPNSVTHSPCAAIAGMDELETLATARRTAVVTWHRAEIRGETQPATWRGEEKALGLPGGPHTKSF